MKLSKPLGRLLPYVFFALCEFISLPVYADCGSPAGKEGDIFYNSASHIYQFCNGTGWMPYTGGSTCTAPTGGYNPTSPSGSGYFVITSTTYNGNLGGLVGADAACLTELTTNTGWLGYSTANSNGQLVANKVFAFLCFDSGGAGSSICRNLMPLTTYKFANVGNGAAGGATFTTDSSGNGPNDAANWSGATYFGSSYSYWAQRYYTGTTTWPAYPTGFGSGGRCSGFTTSSGGDTGGIGITNSTGQTRWYSSNVACNTMLPLICFVNP